MKIKTVGNIPQNFPCKKKIHVYIVSRWMWLHACVFPYSVARFARERVQPLVRKMDAESHMDSAIIGEMFQQGVSSEVT